MVGLNEEWTGRGRKSRNMGEMRHVRDPHSAQFALWPQQNMSQQGRCQPNHLRRPWAFLPLGGS